MDKKEMDLIAQGLESVHEGKPIVIVTDQSKCGANALLGLRQALERAYSAFHQGESVGIESMKKDEASGLTVIVMKKQESVDPSSFL